MKNLAASLLLTASLFISGCTARESEISDRGFPIEKIYFFVSVPDSDGSIKEFDVREYDPIYQNSKVVLRYLLWNKEMEMNQEQFDQVEITPTKSSDYY